MSRSLSFKSMEICKSILRRNGILPLSHTVKKYVPVLNVHSCGFCGPSTNSKLPQDNNGSLLRQLNSMIRFTGPITFHDYMREVLTNPLSGYYMNKDVFGANGDYITSPEISQLFGEMIGIWIYNEWTKMGRPIPLQLAEFGPGRGTLMQDVLRAFCKLSKDVEGVEVHFIERSPTMGRLQEEKLCGISTNDGKDAVRTNDTTYRQSVTTSNIPVFWHTHLEGVPEKFTFFIANEFFDALPVHKLKKTENGWREVLIDIEPKNKDDDEAPLRYIISREHTPASKLFVKDNEKRSEMEVCPEAGVIMQSLASRIMRKGGSLLIVDYGHEATEEDTFRAFRNHQQVDPLTLPGLCDVTADVDFSYMRHLVEDKLVCYGPVTQEFFLTNMGISFRLQNLLTKTSTSKEANILISGYKMLTDPDQMGNRFKFLAMFPKTMESIHKQFPPAGFVNNQLDDER